MLSEQVASQEHERRAPAGTTAVAKPRLNRARPVAVVQWQRDDGMAQAIAGELARLGYAPTFMRYDAPIPPGADIVFSSAPYNVWLQIPRQLANWGGKRRPLFVHWNTEGIPDPRLPWPAVRWISALRSWLGRLGNCEQQPLRTLMGIPPLSLLNAHMHRFRYVGDYYYAQRRGWMDVFADISAVHAGLFCRHGLPALHVPFGASPDWYADLGLERDVDILWMGKRGSRRRSRALDRVRGDLEKRGFRFHMADGVENPFVYGEERTRLLNRTKITLNLLRTWHDDNTLRFYMAAANRSLIVSERLLPHCPAFQPGTHYVSASMAAMGETIQHYLDHEQERRRIVETAYRLVTQELTLRNSIRTLMDAAEQRMRVRSLERLYLPVHPYPKPGGAENGGRNRDATAHLRP